MNTLIKKIVNLAYLQQEGHIPSSLSVLDLLYVFYQQFYPGNKLILSKGHASLGLYSILEHFQLIGDLDDFARFDSKYGGHPSDKIPHVEASTGSLGHGLPIGLGLALGNKIQHQPEHIYVIIGDGEANEGTIWETALLAAHHQLNNLHCIMDYNHSGDRALKIDDIRAKFEAFGWNVIEIDGHDHSAIIQAYQTQHKKPTFILAHTIKGKGIPMMENNPEWHHKSPSLEQYQQIINSL